MEEVATNRLAKRIGDLKIRASQRLSVAERGVNRYLAKRLAERAKEASGNNDSPKLHRGMAQINGRHILADTMEGQ